MADGAVSNSPIVQAQLDRLASLSPGADILGLERISALLDRLGNPHQALPPVFHVAGTNGKGSTCAFLRAMLEADGKRVHVYSSPHLVRFNERVRIAGTLISDDALADTLRRVLDSADGLSPSFFEATTAAAFLAFVETPADACVIEVGLGGRLDATNVLTAPAVCGIANLGLDHERFLLSPEPPETLAPNDPLPRIAFEKAGIAKADVPLVTMDYQPDMNQAIAEVAMRKAARLLRLGSDWRLDSDADSLTVADTNGSITVPHPSLPGTHQVQNAALAIAMLRAQTAVAMSDHAIRTGVLAAHWPARLQLLEHGPLTALTADRPIWLDGGHNAEAGRIIGEHFDRHMAAGKRLHLILGMLDNKDPAALLTPLADRMASLSVVPVSNHDWHDSNAFTPHAPVTPTAFSSVKQAFAALPDDGASVLIGGSLYLAGEVLKANNQLPD